MRALLLASAFISCAMAGPPVLPEPPPPASPVRLSWTSSVESCPESHAVATLLDDLLNDGSATPEVDVVGKIERDGAELRLDLEVTTPAGAEHRELRARDCELLSRAGVLVAAVTIDAIATASTLATREEHGDEALLVPRHDREPPAAEATPRSAAAPPAPARGSAREAPARETRSRVEWRHGLSVAARGGLAIGATPGVTGGVEGELAWRFGPLRVAVGGAHWFGRAASLFDGAGVRAALSTAGLRACGAFTRGRVEVPLCAGLELGAMHGGGRGSAVREERVREPWVGILGGGGVVVWPTRRLGLDLRVDAVVAARRPAMYLEVQGEPVEVFRIPPVGARVLAGLALRVF